MKKSIFKSGNAIVLFLIAFSLISSKAEASRFAVTPKVSTLGLGVEGVYDLSESINFRAGVNAFQYDYSGTEEGVEYNFELKLLNFSLLMDWFPFENGFRLSGGVVINQNGIDFQAKSASSFDLGDKTYTAEEVGTLTGSIDFNAAAPYVGLGWGRPFFKDGNWSIAFDAGVLFQGDPEANLSTNGLLSSDEFKADIDREEKNLQNALDSFNIYPVLSLGVTYRF